MRFHAYLFKNVEGFERSMTNRLLMQNAFLSLFGSQKAVQLLYILFYSNRILIPPLRPSPTDTALHFRSHPFSSSCFPRYC